MTSSRLLIYEPLCGGHRPDFVRYLAEELRRSPYRGTVRFVLGRGFLDSEPELRALLSRLAPAVEVMDALEPADRPASLLKAISDFRPDCVLLFELTKWENFLCRHRLPCDLAGILFVQYPEIEWRKGRGVDRIIRFARRRVKELKLSLWLRRQSVRAVFLLNGERAAAVLNRRFPGRPVFHAVPDPAPSEGVSGCSEAASGRAGVGDAGVSDPGYRAPVLSGSAVAGLAEAGCSTAGRPIRFLLPGAL
ncbi:MAG: hypothetical protein U1E27_03780, partial [Kiritimatiellia bacterium]|nr:hypothetical protein [Kiritimatiellia bacterium]